VINLVGQCNTLSFYSLNLNMKLLKHLLPHACRQAGFAFNLSPHLRLSPRLWLFAFCFLLSPLARAASILIPMDDEQKDHLKSYGIAFWTLKNGEEVDWLLNYRGGSL
jgi:hypothetical protein